MFQQLESRRLLSASAAFDFTTAILTVKGSDGPDQIDVTLTRTATNISDDRIDRSGGLDARALGAESSTRLSAPSARSSSVDHMQVYLDGKLVFSQKMLAGTVKAVEVFGGGGADAIQFYNSGTDVQGIIFGGAGDDSIHSTATAGALPSEVYGGEDRDKIHVVSGKGTLLGHFVQGGSGDDIIVGSSRADMLWGDSTDTRTLVAEAGNDSIYAGDGDDKVYGGDGDDLLFGEVGDDWLEGGDGSDLIDGGDGVDSAVADSSDKLQNVEKLFSPISPRTDRVIDSAAVEVRDTSLSSTLDELR